MARKLQKWEQLGIDGRSRAAVIERSRERLDEPQYIRPEGDNFRFICWGGLQDLKLWDRAMNKTFPLDVNASERKDGDRSVYSRPCPQCGAPAWCYCVTDTGKRTNGATHKKRNASNPNEHTALPDYRAWWKEHTRA